MHALDVARLELRLVDEDVAAAEIVRMPAQLLERDVPYARVTLRLQPGDEALVGQYEGPRLPEGARSLPEGATIRWLLVRVENDAVGGAAR